MLLTAIAKEISSDKILCGLPMLFCVSVKRLVMLLSLLGLLSTLFRTRCKFGMHDRDTYLELPSNFGFGRSVALALFFLNSIVFCIGP